MKLYAHITTEQRLFNAVCRHLARQERRAAVAGSCLYYDPATGDRCAVGGVLTIESADEAERSHSNDTVFGLPISWPNDRMVQLAFELQGAHDNSPNARLLRAALRSIATAWRLDDRDVELITEWVY